MKTKTLLIAAAALAAGVISSQAQVYSQNIVGYVNKPLPLGYSVVSIPLNASNDNSLTNTIPNVGGALNGANLYIYTGTKFNVYTFDDGYASGFGDATDSAEAPTPVINPGVGFFINNNTGTAITNVFVGSVAVNSLPGTTTNTATPGVTFKSSILAIGGGVTSSLQLTNVAGALNGTVVYLPNIYGGQVHGYIAYTFDDGYASGFGDATDSAEASEPQVPVSSAFLYNNNAGLGNVIWKQTLTQ